jgi:4-hydroxy 2-oxovalerate aldolase
MYDVIESLSPQQRTRYGTGYSKTDFSVLDKAFRGM